MSSLIWNPFFGHYIPTHQAKTSAQSHDIVLDLTTEKRSQDLVKKETFDFSKFYKTYQQIASREPPVSRNRKRQLSSESSDSDQSIIQETKKPRTEEILYDNSNSILKGQVSRQQEHLSRGTRGQKEQTKNVYLPALFLHCYGVILILMLCTQTVSLGPAQPPDRTNSLGCWWSTRYRHNSMTPFYNFQLYFVLTFIYDI